MLRAEKRRETRAGMRGEAVGDMPQLGVDRSWVAGNADALAVEG